MLLLLGHPLHLTEVVLGGLRADVVHHHLCVGHRLLRTGNRHRPVSRHRLGRGRRGGVLVARDNDSYTLAITVAISHGPQHPNNANTERYKMSGFHLPRDAFHKE